MVLMPKLSETSPLIAVLIIHPNDPDILYIPKLFPTVTGPAMSMAKTGVTVVAAAKKLYNNKPSNRN